MRIPPSIKPLVRISNGTFYRQHPNSQSSRPNPPLFPNLNFELPCTLSRESPVQWAVVGPSLSGKTTFLQILRGRYLGDPPGCRSYPFLSCQLLPPNLRNPSRAIQYVGFDGEGGGGSILPAGITSAYLSARYESLREDTDFSLRDYLLGNTELNPASPKETRLDEGLFLRTVKDLGLESLLHVPAAFLSNGQTRRARIGRALLAGPKALLLDEPFMGLDPATVSAISRLLGDVARRAEPIVVLSARPQDLLPEWVTHAVVLGPGCVVERAGELDDGERKRLRSSGKPSRSDSFAVPRGTPTRELGEPLVEMEGVQVRYGEAVALGGWKDAASSTSGLSWTVRRGDRWGVFGPNGSGKTTLVSLLTSDHPQAYALPIRLFGRSRLPEAGSGKKPLTFWDVQARIGHSSPEVHRHMPRDLTVRRVVEGAWADTFRARPKLDGNASDKVAACLGLFERDLNPDFGVADGERRDTWMDRCTFGELPLSAQRVALFLRAVIKTPDVVVLDEAFSGMDQEVVAKCFAFLEAGEQGVRRRMEDGEFSQHADGRTRIDGLSDHQALVCISHVRDEVPGCVRQWLYLPEPGGEEPARTGELTGPLADEEQWLRIWGLEPRQDSTTTTR